MLVYGNGNRVGLLASHGPIDLGVPKHARCDSEELVPLLLPRLVQFGDITLCDAQSPAGFRGIGEDARGEAAVTKACRDRLTEGVLDMIPRLSVVRRPPGGINTDPVRGLHVPSL